MTDSKRSRYEYLRVYYAGRRNYDPPEVAPYDFGIDAEWWETVGKKLRDDPAQAGRVFDFLTYGDPLGFGENKD